MVRELQICAAAVDIEGVTKQLLAHGRAFDVPAGAAFAPRAFPKIYFIRLGRFPQHEVQRIAFKTVHFHPLTGAQIIQRFTGKLAVSGKFAHGVIHIAIGGRIGFAVGNQAFNHADHFADMLGGFWLDIGAQHTQCIGIFVHRLNKTGGQFADGFAVFRCTSDDFVVDIGDIAHISERITVRTQPARNHIEHHHHAAVAEVAIVVNGHAANIHAHVFRIDGRERFFLSG